MRKDGDIWAWEGQEVYKIMDCEENVDIKFFSPFSNTRTH